MTEGTRIARFLFFAVVAAGFLFRPPAARADGANMNLSPAQAREMIGRHAGEADFVILDVRTPGEFRSERIDGAVLVDYNSGNFRSELRALDREKTYLVYCRTGNRSGGAVRAMKEEGFRNVYHLDGGIVNWKEAGFPVRN